MLLLVTADHSHVSLRLPNPCLCTDEPAATCAKTCIYRLYMSSSHACTANGILHGFTVMLKSLVDRWIENNCIDYAYPQNAEVGIMWRMILLLINCNNLSYPFLCPVPRFHHSVLRCYPRPWGLWVGPRCPHSSQLVDTMSNTGTEEPSLQPGDGPSCAEPPRRGRGRPRKQPQVGALFKIQDLGCCFFYCKPTTVLGIDLIVELCTTTLPHWVFLCAVFLCIDYSSVIWPRSHVLSF